MDDIQLLAESLLTKTEHAAFENLVEMSYTVTKSEVKEEEDDVLPSPAAVTLHPVKEEEDEDGEDPLGMPDCNEPAEEELAIVCKKEPSDAVDRNDRAVAVQRKHGCLLRRKRQRQEQSQGRAAKGLTGGAQEALARNLQRLQERRILSAQRRAAWKERQIGSRERYRRKCDALKAQLIAWRRAKEGRLVRGGGLQTKRQQQIEQRQSHLRDQQVQPLTRRQQAVIEDVLPLQAAWTKFHATHAQQQDSHARHVAAVTKVLDATVRELREKFPTENIPSSNALTETMLNLITNSGLNPKALVSFLQKLGIIKDTAFCPQQWHAEPTRMLVYSRTRGGTMVFSWRCSHTIEGRRCGKTESLFQGTIFEECKVPIRDKLLVVLRLLQHHSYEDILNEVSVSLSTIVAWKNDCREYFRMYGKLMRRIGGPRTVVEIGVTQIDKRKYFDQTVQPPIVLGGVERNTGKTFIVQIPDNSAITLCSIIVQFVAPGGTVVTDEHAGYNALSGLGYRHKVAHQKTDSANPQDREAYTSTIEGKWSLLKTFLREHASYCPTVSLEYLLAEYLFYSDCANDKIEPSIKFLALLRGGI